MNKTLSTTFKYFFTQLFLLGAINSVAQDIFFSEYVEGSGNNKCLELFNPTSTRIDLAPYTVQIFTNGSSSPVGVPWDLSGRSIAPLSTLVLCSGLADAPLQATEDGHFGFGSFNGDDAIVLYKNGRRIDIIGVIGCDPGEAWTSGNLSTKDATLVRTSCVAKGNANSSGCSFSSLNSEWIALPKDNYSNLGKHNFGLVPIEIIGNSALCDNPSVTLTVSPENLGSYKWSTGSSSNQITVNSAGLYKVTVTNNNCEIVAEKQVNGTSPAIIAEISKIRDVSCKPKRDGAIEISASGGSGNFRYEWAGGSTPNNTINGLGAGNHTITVVDGNGCSEKLTATVNGPVIVPLNPPVVKNETCKNRSDGSITLSATGNNLEYSIDGTNFQSSGVFTDLPPGKYPVIVRNQQGCGDASQVTINGGTKFDLRNSIVTQAKCQSSGGGQVILNPTGGLPPFQVSFDSKPFTPNLVFSNLKGGIYPFIVRDGSGCVKEFEQIINEGSKMTVDFSKEDATCAGIDDGIIRMETNDGTGIISYFINDDIIPSFFINEFENLSVGTHRITVVDSFDCRITGELTIEEKIKLKTNITAEARCSDDPSGIITIEPENGEAPYSYSLDSVNFSNNNVFENLPPDTYRIITKDNLGCTSIEMAAIMATSNFEIVLVPTQPESCAGASDGQLSIITNNSDDINVEYSIDGINYQSLNVFSNLVPQEYMVYARGNGCADSTKVTIEPSNPITFLSSTTRAPMCGGGSDGQIRVNVLGGKEPYIYQIIPSSFQSSHIFDGLSEGNYVITVTDANDCEATTSVQLTEPIAANPTCSVTQNVTSKGGMDGIGAIEILGGAPPFNVQLLDANFNNRISIDGTETFEGLAAGTYTVEITDQNGCKSSCEFTIEEPLCDFSIDATKIDVTCFEGTDGSIKLELENGTAPFFFDWSNDQYDTQQDISNASAGTYQVIASDQAGCSDTATITINQPEPLSVNILVGNSTICEKDSTRLTVDGSFDKYLWSNELETAAITVSEAGEYQVIVVDEQGCSAENSITIVTIPQDTIYQDLFTCQVDQVGTFNTEERGTDGCMDVIFSTFALARKDTTLLDATTCDPMQAGVTANILSNAFGCDSLVITTTELLRRDTTYLLETSCDSDQVGIRQEVVPNAVGCDSLLIIETTLNASFDTEFKTVFTCNPSEAITDTLVLKNTIGCDSLVITTTELLRRDTTYLLETSCDSDQVGIRQEIVPNTVGCDSLLIIETTLNDRIDKEFKTAFTCNPTDAIVDTLVLKNSMGCDSLVITNTELLLRDTTYLLETSCFSNEVGIQQRIETNEVGCDSLVITETILDESIDTEFKTVFTCNPSAVNTDTLFLSNFRGCDSLVITETILNPSNITQLQEFTCEAANVGIDTFYLVNQFQCDSLVITTTLLAEEHFMEFTEVSCNPIDTGLFRQALLNRFGCDSIVETRVRLAPLNDCQISLTALAPTVCGNESIGTITLQSTEGNPPLNYYVLNTNQQDTFAQGIILNHGEEISIDNLPIGDFIIKLANQGNITATENISILQFPAIQINTIVSDYNGFGISCEGETDGSIETTINGGQTPYTFEWNTGSTTNNLQNLAIGNYTLSVTDANNCEESIAFDLAAPNTLSIDYQSFSPNCSEDEFGRIVINKLNNASGKAEYSLDGTVFQPIGNLPFTINNLRPENYQLFIQDENDCQWSDAFTIPMPNENSLTLGNTQSLVLGDSLTLRPKANFDIARYEWTSEDGTICADCSEITIQPTSSTSYQLTAYDANGCSISDFLLVNVRKDNQVYLPNVFSPNGDGQNDIYQVYTGNSIRRIQSFEIVDYEGRRMYKVTDRLPTDNLGWNGIFNGQKMLPAVFIVFVKVELLDGTEREYIQTMNLVK